MLEVDLATALAAGSCICFAADRSAFQAVTKKETDCPHPVCSLPTLHDGPDRKAARLRCLYPAAVAINRGRWHEVLYLFGPRLCISSKVGTQKCQQTARCCDRCPPGSTKSPLAEVHTCRHGTDESWHVF